MNIFVSLGLLISLNFVFINGQVSVSGLSSGAYAAVQYHVIYSSQLQGVGVIAGGPYWCANGNLVTALTACMADPQYISVDELIVATSYAYSLDSIDDPSNLQKQQVWLFSGTQDTIVFQGVMKKLYSYYENYVSPNNIATVFNISAEHSWVTNDWGHSCEFFGTPYINNCGYDSAGQLLQHIYGTLKAPTQLSNLTANLESIDQSSFIPSFYNTETAALEDTAYYYLPTDKCSSSSCKIHISFHGCNQTLQDINMIYMERVGLNEWAETNNIIVLYPQAKKTTLNPQGCWDWWGYTGLDYCTNEAAQMVTVNSMVGYLKSKYTVA